MYRGKQDRLAQGWYVYGDNGPAGKIRAFVWDGDSAARTRSCSPTRDGIHLDSDITSFGEDADGELYMTTHTSVYRIEAK